jgi:starvation-inducible outer membrane lipoprotein
MIQEYLPQLLEVCREVRIRGKIAVAIDKHLAVCLEVMMRLD